MSLLAQMELILKPRGLHTEDEIWSLNLMIYVQLFHGLIMRNVIFNFVIWVLPRYLTKVYNMKESAWMLHYFLLYVR